MGGDLIYAGNLVGLVDPISAETYMGGDPISAGNLDGLGSHICRKPRGGDPVPTGSQMWDPISAGNLDAWISYLQET